MGLFGLNVSGSECGQMLRFCELGYELSGGFFIICGRISF
jgi:hypothetical protein